ncbi:MAG: transposase [Patescibacteria group bacterium]|nr:transposase [Patescibacteria group bacterium]MBU2508900.1 transposase [Patescibacteria group bacterium]
MPRAPRIIDPNSVYHITGRGNNRSTIFHVKEDYQRYYSLLKEKKKTYGFSIFHYTLMPNHIHLLVRPNNAEFSAAMHAVQMNYAKDYCKKYNFKGHVWQGRFDDSRVENDAYLFACGNYIETNPVRAGLVVNPEDWDWSSYRFYAFAESNDIVDLDPLFDSLGLSDEKNRIMYRALVDKTRAV